MTKSVPCPRCKEMNFLRTKFKHGCLLCDDNHIVSSPLAAAYRLLSINGLPGRFPIEQIREDLGE